jgi:hypothetical protein
MANMIKFYRGLVNNLPATGENGALYITTDEGAIYYGTGTGMKRLGDFIQVANVAALPEKAHESCLYYCVAENILAKWNGTEWKQINKQPTAEEMKTLLGLGAMAYKSEVVEGDLNADLKAKVNAAAEGNHSHDNKALLDTYTQTEADLADAVAKKHSHSFSDEAALNGITAAKVADWDDAVSKEHTHTFADADVVDAISKKHAHTFVESELNKIVAGDVAKWNGVVADHLVAADKTELADSISDVNTALENYKTSNDAALAGVKATAEAAATKEYTDAELAKKVAKTDYEADKATFATKTELNGVDSKFANYKTAADQKLIDDAQDVEIAKKVDKVEGKDLIATSEIERLATLHNYDDTQVNADIAKKADAEAMTTELGKKVDKVAGYSLVSDTEIARLAEVDNYDDAEVRGLIGDNADAIAEIAGDYVKAADIADFETKANVKKVADDLAAYVESNDAAVANRYTKSEADEKFALKGADAYDDEEVRGLISDNADAIAAEKERAEAAEAGLQTQINTIMNNPDAEGAINSINEFTQYVKDHGTIADGFRADIDKNKEDIAANTKAIGDEAARADAAEKALAGRLDTLEAIDHDAYVAADTALKTELEGKIADAKTEAANQNAVVLAESQKYTDSAITTVEGKVTELSGNTYSKEETFTKDEVNAAIEAALTVANSWGEF